MYDTPVRLCRPDRAFDGEGSSEEWDEGNARTIWVDMVEHEGQQTIAVNADEEVRIGDLIEVPYESTLRGI